MQRLTLILLMLLAACVAGGGIIAARRVVETRVERDRTAQRELVASLHTETRRLEQVYEGHLSRAALQLANEWADSSDRQLALAQEVEGIQRVSWLPWKNAERETHLSIGFPPNPPLPEPTLIKEHKGLPRPRVLLDVETLFPGESGHHSGWIDEPGKPLMFHLRSGVVAVVLSIERTAVRRVVTAQLREMPRVQQALSGPDELREEGGVILHSAGTLPEAAPDVLMSISSRFGTWQLASWDQREKRITYHAPTLAGAMALAVLVAVLGIGLSAQQARAARLAAQRVSFVNRVSHELRTPMTNILLNLDIIEENIPVTSAPRFGLIREEAGRLSRLIENVLTFSQSEEGRLKLHPSHVSPAEIVDRVVRQFEPALLRRHITLTRVHEGLHTLVMLDADALSQITANLLSNVEKYAPDAPALVHTQQTADAFTLTVSDAGKGIPFNEAERIFHPFTRLDDRVQAGVSGTGLGLSIARDLAQHMGGTLRLIPSEKGSRFEFTLPLSPNSPP